MPVLNAADQHATLTGEHSRQLNLYAATPMVIYSTMPTLTALSGI
jgi:hypothetical protein